MERALRSFSWRPTCRPPRMTTHIGEDGHWSSGSVCLSAPNLLRKFFRGLLYARSPRGSAQARHLFGHVASCVWPSSRVPNGRACGRLESDRILASFSGRLQHGEVPELFPAFLDTVGSRKPIQEWTWWSAEKHGHDHLNMELPRMAVSDQTRHVPFVLALKSAHVTTTPSV